MYFNKIKTLCTSKDTIQKIKRSVTDQAKIFPNHISDKILAAKMY